MSAVFSDCGTYRYSLERDLGFLGTGTVLFVMLNPSTADGEHDDPTIRRCIGFAQSWGYGKLAVGNLYAYRATKPDDLFMAEDPVGPANDQHLRSLAADAAQIVVAWGARGVGKRADEVLNILLDEQPPAVFCLGQCDNGAPRHPLYVRGDQQPTTYLLPEIAA